MVNSSQASKIKNSKIIGWATVILSLLFIPPLLFIMVILSNFGGAGVYGYSGLMAVNNIEPGFQTYLKITGLLDAVALVVYAAKGGGPTYRKLTAALLAGVIVILFGAVMLTRGF